MGGFVILLAVVAHRLHFGFGQHAGVRIPHHRTVADVAQDPDHPVLGVEDLFEPTVVHPDDFPVHLIAQFQEIKRILRRHVVPGKGPKSVGDDASTPRDVTNVPTLHVGGVGGTRGDDAHVFGQMHVQAHIDLP